jgi:hypothetical protein
VSPSQAKLFPTDSGKIERWAIAPPIADARLLARLVTFDSVTMCMADGTLWIQGKCQRDDEREIIEEFVSGDKYHVLPDGQLIPWIARVPKGYLPAGPWAAVHHLWKPQLPTAAMAIGKAPRAAITMVRDTHERPCNLLLTSQAHWTAFTKTCSQVRLAKWSFAASADGRILIRGTPLPPVPGTRYVEQAAVAVEAGSWWSPAVSPHVMRRALSIPSGAIGLLSADGQFELIPGQEFVTATRSAVAATARVAGGRDV